MSCKEWNDQWIARLYDELDPDEDRRAGAHLDACAPCRETLDALSETRQLLRESATAVPAAPRVLVLKPRRWGQPAWAFAAGMAAAAALFVVVLYTLPLGPAADRQEVAQLKSRLAELELAANAPAAGLTRAQLDTELARWTRQAELGRARDVEFLLGEINAVERRTGNYINNNSETLLRVALASKNAGLSQH